MNDPLRIVLDAAQEHVNEIEHRSHSDAAITRSALIATAIKALRDPSYCTINDRLIYVVPCNTTDGLRLYLFASERRACQYARLHPGALVYPEILINDSAADQLLIDSAGEEPADHQTGTPRPSGENERR